MAQSSNGNLKKKKRVSMQNGLIINEKLGGSCLSALAALLAVFAIFWAILQQNSTEDEFTNWLSSLGVRSELEFVVLGDNSASNRDTVTKRYLQPNDPVMVIPRQAILAASDVLGLEGTKGLRPEDATALEDIARAVLHDDDRVVNLTARSQIVLALAVLWHRRSFRIHNIATKWSPYVEILPEKAEGMPRFLSASDLHWLNGTEALEQGRLRERRILGEFELLSNALEGLKADDFSEYLWARDMVDSRCFMLDFQGTSKEVALVPLADMPNHENEHCALSHEIDGNGNFVATSRCALPRGTIVHNWYGFHGNVALMVQWGFALEDNPFDSVHMYYYTSDQKYERSCKLLKDPEKSAHSCVSVLTQEYMSRSRGIVGVAVHSALLAVSSQTSERVRYFESRSPSEDVSRLAKLIVLSELEVWQAADHHARKLFFELREITFDALFLDTFLNLCTSKSSH